MIDCRGRNNWFKLHKASANVYGNRAAVRMESKRGYMDVPPIYFSGPINEVLEVLDKLREQVLSGRIMAGMEAGGR
jgi:hypothetical protein